LLRSYFSDSSFGKFWAHLKKLWNIFPASNFHFPVFQYALAK
jgi:hypothetical protein